jgi:hypothetical protein
MFALVDSKPKRHIWHFYPCRNNYTPLIRGHLIGVIVSNSSQNEIYLWMHSLFPFVTLSPLSRNKHFTLFFSLLSPPNGCLVPPKFFLSNYAFLASVFLSLKLKTFCLSCIDAQSNSNVIFFNVFVPKSSPHTYRWSMS